MRHLKLFESFNDIESIKDELNDLFIYFEEDDWSVRVSYSKIVPNRNDWTGNFTCTKVRNVYGKEFIDYNKDVIMTKDGKTWVAQDAFTVTINTTNYIKPNDNFNPYNDKSFEEHWSNLDDYIINKLPAIESRAKRLGLELFGIHGKWFTLGEAKHPSFSNEPYFGWYMLADIIEFAFTPQVNSN